MSGNRNKKEKSKGKEKTCESCQQDFYSERLNLKLPWEDGNNAYAYWRCPNCGHKNTEYGYGEDD